MKTLNKAMLDKILYIGNEIPDNFTSDKRDKFILLGTPQELIDEVGGKLKDKTEHDIICWVAEYTYKMANPDSKMDVPSIVYEKVENDFSKFLNTSTKHKD